MEGRKEEVSIRYIAVLGFQPHWKKFVMTSSGKGFHPLYRGTWFPTMLKVYRPKISSLRFHPLYRGTWFPTLPEKHPL